MDKNLPIYDVKINDNDQTGTNFISLVEQPALEIEFHAFNSQEGSEQDEVKLSSEVIGEISLKKMDQQRLIGPIAIPDLLIYRKDNVRGEWNMRFSKEEIQKMADKFNEYSLNQNVNLNHEKDSKIPSTFVAENWIVEAKNDKSKNHGFDFPEGTWVSVIKVKDNQIWEDLVKGGKVKGFSLEGLLGLEKQKLEKMENTNTEVKMEVEAILKDGSKLVAADWNVGTEVFLVTPEGIVPAETRAYEAEDGTLIEVVDGKVANVTPASEVANDKTIEGLKKEVSELTEKLSKIEASLATMLETNKKENEDLKNSNEELAKKVEEISKTSATLSITKRDTVKTILNHQGKEAIEDTVARLKRFNSLK